MLNSVLSDSISSLNIYGVLLCIVASVILGFLIALTYKLTSRYNKSFLVTLTFLPLLVQIIVLVVNGNLGLGVAIAGAFGLVRFRSIAGTSKEILYVFYSMTIGLIVGTGCIILASIITAFLSILLLIIEKTSIFEVNKNERILKITIPEDLDYTDIFDDILKKYTTKYNLEQVKTTALGSMFDVKYSLVMKKNINEKKFIDELRVRNGNLKIILTHDNGSSEL